MGERALRPFWLHQIVEYLIGIALIAQGLQGPKPVLPCVAGMLIMLNAAITIGPASAFRLIPRRVHKWFDVVVFVLILAVAVRPPVDLDAGGRLVMVLILVAYAFVWWYTDFAEKKQRKQRRAATASPRSDEIGRSAGRVAGNVAKAFKNWSGSSDD